MGEVLYGGLGNTRRTEERLNRYKNPRIAFVGPKQASYQCLFSATRDHFRDVDVVLIDRLQDTHEPDHDVGLVLLGASAKVVGLAAVEECFLHFPNAAIAIAVENGMPMIEPALIERRLIQGIFSTTLPLDVWMALVRLVLAGGEYLPYEEAWSAAHFMPMQQTVPPSSRASSLHGGPIDNRIAAAALTRRGSAGVAENGLDALTAREHEILMLVSAGFQNKLIADRTGLSENTVKAHVHNLIAKLRVTNRTQAAAYMHQHQFDKKAGSAGHGDPRAADETG